MIKKTTKDKKQSKDLINTTQLEDPILLGILRGLYLKINIREREGIVLSLMKNLEIIKKESIPKIAGKVLEKDKFKSVKKALEKGLLIGEETLEEIINDVANDIRIGHPPLPNINDWNFLIIGKCPGETTLKKRNAYFLGKTNIFRDLWDDKTVRDNKKQKNILDIQERFLDNKKVVLWDRTQFFYAKDGSSKDKDRVAILYSDVKNFLKQRKNKKTPVIIIFGYQYVQGEYGNVRNIDFFDGEIPKNSLKEVEIDGTKLKIMVCPDTAKSIIKDNNKRDLWNNSGIPFKDNN